MLADTASAKDTKAPPKPQNVLSPDAALKKLMEGNARYVDGTARRHDFKHEREALAVSASISPSADAPNRTTERREGDVGWS